MTVTAKLLSCMKKVSCHWLRSSFLGRMVKTLLLNWHAIRATMDYSRQVDGCWWCCNQFQHKSHWLVLNVVECELPSRLRLARLLAEVRYMRIKIIKKKLFPTYPNFLAPLPEPQVFLLGLIGLLEEGVGYDKFVLWASMKKQCAISVFFTNGVMPDDFRPCRKITAYGSIEIAKNE